MQEAIILDSMHKQQHIKREYCRIEADVSTWKSEEGKEIKKYNGTSKRSMRIR